jgi:hypothetical protein
MTESARQCSGRFLLLDKIFTAPLNCAQSLALESATINERSEGKAFANYRDSHLSGMLT